VPVEIAFGVEAGVAGGERLLFFWLVLECLLFLPAWLRLSLWAWGRLIICISPKLPMIITLPIKTAPIANKNSSYHRDLNID